MRDLLRECRSIVEFYRDNNRAAAKVVTPNNASQRAANRRTADKADKLLTRLDLALSALPDRASDEAAPQFDIRESTLICGTTNPGTPWLCAKSPNHDGPHSWANAAPPAGRGEGEKLRNRIGGLHIVGGDNLSIALCTYFSSHLDRPENDEDTEHGWGEWVEQQCNKTLDDIADTLRQRLAEENREIERLQTGAADMFIKLAERNQDQRERAAQAEALLAGMRKWLDNNTTFYNVDADWPVYGNNIPVLASVSERIWYHATDNIKDYPFSAVIDTALDAPDAGVVVPVSLLEAARNVSSTLDGGFCVCQTCGSQEDTTDFDFAPELKRELEAYDAARPKAAPQATVVRTGGDSIPVLAGAAPSPKASQEREAGERDCWLVRSMGGEGPPGHAFCYTLDQVRNTIAELCWGHPENAHAEELDAYMADFTNPEQWGGDGTYWNIKFEIDGIEAFRLLKSRELPAPPAAAGGEG